MGLSALSYTPPSSPLLRFAPLPAHSMEVKASTAPERPGKTAMWTTSRAAGKYDTPERAPSSTQPPSVGSLDSVRAVFWEAYRHLFPPHSLAAQTSNGSIVISWSIADEPHAKYPYAAPVLLRFEQDLIDAMWRAEPRYRERIAHHHEGTLREGLRGYDPFARFPNARIVTIG
jgi:hypothetical protein